MSKVHVLLLSLLFGCLSGCNSAYHAGYFYAPPAGRDHEKEVMEALTALGREFKLSGPSQREDSYFFKYYHWGRGILEPTREQYKDLDGRLGHLEIAYYPERRLIEFLCLSSAEETEYVKAAREWLAGRLPKGYRLQYQVFGQDKQKQ